MAKKFQYQNGTPEEVTGDELREQMEADDDDEE